MQVGEAIETAVNLTIDAAWYAAIFVVVAIVVLAGLDPVLLVPMPPGWCSMRSCSSSSCR
jgi:ATP-binding cassette subfamily B multidrug efflux pump